MSRYTVLDKLFCFSCTGSFGEWMNCHPENLGCIIPLILQGLGNTEVATAATMALKDVSRENLDHMQPYTGQILSACQVGCYLLYKPGIMYS